MSDTEPEKRLDVDEDRVKDAVIFIMDECQSKGFSEMEAYMAMVCITKSMEEKLGFRTRRATQA